MLSMTEQNARINDIFTGPWFIRAVATGVSPKLALRMPHHSEGPVVYSFSKDFSKNVELLEIIGLAVRCGYVPLASVHSQSVEMLERITRDKHTRESIYAGRYWGIVDLASRLALPLSPFVSGPVQTHLQIYFASLLATHREIQCQPDLSLALARLDQRFMSSEDQNPTEEKIRPVSEFLHLEDRYQPFYLSKGVPSELDDGILELVKVLGRLFAPMSSEERSIIGTFYASAFMNLLHRASYGIKNRYDPLMRGSRSLKEEIIQYVRGQKDSESYALSEALQIIEATFLDAEGKHALPQTGGWGGPGGSGETYKPPRTTGGM
jgi:hypothetical protein